MNLKNIQRTICFAVGLVCLIASSWAGDAVARAQISLASSTSDASSGSVQIIVTFSGGPGLNKVDYSTSNGTAISGANYTATSGTLTFYGYASQQAIEVPILNNGSQTKDLTFSVTISKNPTSTGGFDIYGIATKSVTIAAPTSTTIAFNYQASTSRLTPASDKFLIVVTRSGITTVTSTVSYATSNGTATAGTNYTATSGTLSFAAGETSKTITVPILNSSSQTSILSLLVTLSNPSSGATISNATWSVFIEYTALSISSDASVIEPSSSTGRIDLIVTRTAGTTLPANIKYTTSDGTAIAGINYRAVSGTLSFSGVAQVTASVAVPILYSSSQIQMSDLVFYVTLSDPSTGVTVGNAKATVTIKALSRLSTVSQTVVAATAGSVALTVARTGGTGISTVNYATSNGTATAGTNYTATSGTLSFAVNETSKTITVPILNSSTQSSDLTFSVTLSSPSSGTTISNASGTVTVTTTLQSSTVSISSSTSTTSSSGSTTLTVTRSGSTTGTSTVSYATSNGTATAGTNYTATTGTLSFAVNETSKTITVPILNSASQVSDLTFLVTLSNPSSGTTISNASGTVTVVSGGLALNGTNYAIIPSVWTGLNGNNSYIRLQNGDTAAHSVGIKVVGNTSGNVYGTATYTVGVMASPQLSISQILTDTRAGSFSGGDTGYSLYITPATKVTFQHVIYNSISTFLENVSTCRYRVGSDYSSLNKTLWNVHTSVLVNNYPAFFTITNTENVQKPIRLDIYEGENGKYINTWNTNLSANQTLGMTGLNLERLISWQPSPSNFHLNIVVSGGDTPFTGLLESLVTNQSLYTSVNMGQVCPTW